MNAVFKPTTARYKAPNTVTLETSPYRDHFEFVADSVVCKHESRPQSLKTLAAMIDEYQPATFVESTLVASLASDRWRQFRYCGMLAAATASDAPGRAGLMKLFASRERHCKRLYNGTRKALLKVLAYRVNNAGRRTPAPAVAATKKIRTTRSAMTGGSNLHTFPTRASAGNRGAEEN
jgi:hypothetical protein